MLAQQGVYILSHYPKMVCFPIAGHFPVLKFDLSPSSMSYVIFLNFLNIQNEPSVPTSLLICVCVFICLQGCAERMCMNLCVNVPMRVRVRALAHGHS